MQYGVWATPSQSFYAAATANHTEYNFRRRGVDLLTDNSRSQTIARPIAGISLKEEKGGRLILEDLLGLFAFCGRQAGRRLCHVVDARKAR